MKFDSFAFSIPKATGRGAPFVQRFLLLLPVLVEVNLVIPPGHKGTAHIDISTPGHALIMMDARGDDQEKRSGRLGLRMFGPPYYLICSGWNEDNFLPHEFVIEVNTDER